MAKVIAFCNQKGGVAKTTSCHNIATAKAVEGKNVLMIDLDPQASLTIMCGIEPFDDDLGGHSICDLFGKGKVDTKSCIFNVVSSGLDNLDLIPSNIELSRLALELVNRYSREKLLKNVLKQVQDEYDYIFIDCPPELGMLSLNGMCAADYIIVPVKADYVSYRGLDALMDTLAEVKEPNNELNSNLQIKGVIITLYEKIISDQQAIAELIEKKYPVIGRVKKSADAYRSVLDGKAAVQTQKSSDVASSYIQIAKSI